MSLIDLSSLEGPPIDPRPHSTEPSWGNDIPDVYRYSSAGPSGPPRPASADPAQGSRSKSPSAVSGASWQRHGRDNVQRSTHLTPENAIGNGTFHRRVNHSTTARPNSYLGHSSPSSIFDPYPESQRAISQTRAQSASPAEQLVWLDNHSVWVRANDVPMPLTLNTGNRGVERPNARRPPALAHSQSMDSTFFANEHNRDLGIPTSPPPPYEQHIFDRPFSQMPSNAGEGSHSSRLTAQDSLWATVAGRRASRIPSGN
ncbi:hypothetical protein BDV25DRAFT_124331 [Aspergillus avenaceus]|uniref:Uncharacterized protein n=1 Tax=Aspergillus avenaceus TaxID=36643 RepID=A0A5N6TTJ9_ASPAV|nr:hypothetical protein BDV25DRAFT_124331 [Aspergillus avenaceus]